MTPPNPTNRLRTRIVCWYCKCSHRPLSVLRDEAGETTPDYACDRHFVLGRPAIGNQSRLRYDKEPA